MGSSQVWTGRDGPKETDKPIGVRSWATWRKCALATTAGLMAALALAPDYDRAVVVSVIRSTAQEHGLDPDHFVRMAQIESGFDPFAYHPVSKASGLFQFLPSTARQYKLENVFEPRANANAAAELWADNARALRKGLGREPSPGELYLAHQQGASGALRLLANPESPASDIVGPRAVTMNGGTKDMTAHQFAAMWIERFRQN